MVITGKPDEDAITHTFVKALCAGVAGADFERNGDVSRDRRATLQPV